MESIHIIDIDEVVYDASVYPRSKWNTDVINQYADAMKAGDEFPPIAIEKGTNRILDGVHRWKAHYQYLDEYESATEEDKEKESLAPIGKMTRVVYHTIPDDVPIRLYAASLSVNHGLRISRADRKNIAREIYERNPDYVLNALRQYLGVSIGTAHSYVADILARRREAQQMTAYRLHLLGWTQEEIGEVIGVTQRNISNFSEEFSELKKVLKNLSDGGLPYLDIAERHNMPLILVWASVLDGLTDQERMNKLNVSIQPYDVWNFSKCHDLFGASHPGRIPGQLLAHVLYFFTEQGDVIIDPMCGSGTTQDVCLAMGRHCYAYDIDTRHERSDVITHDLSEGWPDRIKKADLIFWDPPYFEKMDKKTIGQDGYIDGSISSLGRDDYLSFLEQKLSEAYKSVKSETRIAFLMSDWDDNTGNRNGIFVWDYANIMEDAGWKLTRHIQTPLSTQQVHPDIVNRFRESKRLARLERYVIIGTK